MHTTKVFTAVRHRIRGQAPQEKKHIPPSPTIAVSYADKWWGLPAVLRSDNNWVAKKSNTCGLFWDTMIVSCRGVASLALSLSRSSSRKSSRNILVRTHTNFTKLLFFFLFWCVSVIGGNNSCKSLFCDSSFVDSKSNRARTISSTTCNCC